MLEQLSDYLTNNNYSQFETVVADASELPFENERFDAVVSFNAIHHFDLEQAISEMVRVTKNNGYIFIYTRTPSQNSQSIWGRHLPSFNEKETRLHSISVYENICRKSESISLLAAHYYHYKRKATLSDLIKKANLKNYSTFNLYSQEELKSSINEFGSIIKNNYLINSEVTWLDHNVLIIIEKKTG